MWDLCTNSLDTARLRGASYGDVRVMHLRQRDLTTKNGRVGTLSQSESIGLGIRVLADGAWGFASTDRLTREGVAACAAQAVSLAKASALAKRGEVVLAPEKVYVDSWQSPFRKDPFELPLETQLALLLAADAEMPPLHFRMKKFKNVLIPIVLAASMLCKVTNSSNRSIC